MIEYTTCVTCQKQMQVASEDGDHHPACAAPPSSRMDRLMEQYLKAALTDNNTAEEARIKAEIEELDSRPPRLREAALLYASWGWHVFPLRGPSSPCLKKDDPKSKCVLTGICQCPKIPATPRGFKDATTDMDKIDRYWTRYPDANIGLPTGVMFDVIDIDVPVGVRSWCDLLAADKQDFCIPNDGAEVHGKVVTASGGQHLYVPRAPGLRNRASFVPGIDVRARGGYVVAPPSWLGRKGTSWSWVMKPSPSIRKVEADDGNGRGTGTD